MARTSRYRPPALLWPIAALLWLSPIQPGGAAELPEIGDPVATTLSWEEEYQIGKGVMSQLRGHSLVVDDPLLVDYINRLGNGLAATLPGRERPFEFFIVRDESINAFALPGGFIGVHSGLILASRSESELAAVLAHEIAHVTQRHIARSYEKASALNLPLTAAVIAAILLGGENAQVAQAALATTIATSTQLQLDFTRAHEEEADRIGIEMLAHADYDPKSMAGFFQRLQEESRYYDASAPEFLRTHPVTTNRIADAENRATHYPPHTVANQPRPYQLARAKLRAATAKNPPQMVERIENELKETQGKAAREGGDEYAAYTIALLHLQGGDLARADNYITAIEKARPGSLEYLLLRANWHEQGGRMKQAGEKYRQLLELYPNNATATLAYCRLLMAADTPDECRIPLLQLQRSAPQFAPTYQLLAEVEAELGHPGESHWALAEYYILEGELHAAVEQLQIAQRHVGEDFYLASKVEARLQELRAKIPTRQPSAQHKKQ